MIPDLVVHRQDIAPCHIGQETTRHKQYLARAERYREHYIINFYF